MEFKKFNLYFIDLEKKVYSSHFKEKKLLRKIKKIPSNIGDYLTPVALAHWIMGDGYFLAKHAKHKKRANLIYLYKLVQFGLYCPITKSFFKKL
jgi:hypothetical protein